MSQSSPVIASQLADATLRPAPIRPSWIKSGNPVARAAMLSESPDKSACTFLWECTAGTFRWHFDADETVHVIDGSVVVHWNGERITLKAGDTCYFPAGSAATWIVRSHVRKIAFIRVPAPLAISFMLRAWRALARRLSRPSDRPSDAMASPGASGQPQLP